MKTRNLLIMAIALQSSFAMANYVNYGANFAWGDLNDATNWEGGVVPSGSTTGVVSDAIVEAWAYSFSDISIRQTGSYVGQATDRFADPITFYDPNPAYETLFNGGSVSGVVGTVYEIDDPRTDYASYTNFNVGKLAFWSANGGETEFSILSGHVETKILRLVAWDKGTINMRDGILHAEASDQSGAQFNMLAGGTGDITIDAVSNEVFEVNFETGNRGSFTLGSKEGGSAAGVWGYHVGNGNIRVNGVVNTNALQYEITNDGDASTIAMRSPVDISEYDLFLGWDTNALLAVGGLAEPGNYESGTLPDGNPTNGLILYAHNVWGGEMQDLAVRLEGGRIFTSPDGSAGTGEFLLAGPSSNAPAGTLCLLEIDADDYASVTNLDVGVLALWPEQGGDMELNILNGTVVTPTLKLTALGKGTINMGNGSLHAGTNISDGAQFNMLDGGTGNITIDGVANELFDVNFEIGSEASFTLGSKNGGSAVGVWDWAVTHSNITINGELETNLSSFDITTTDGVNTTIALYSGYHAPTNVSWIAAGADNLWATAANWDVGVPLPGDSVVIDDGGAGALKEAGNDADGLIDLKVGLDNTGALTIGGAVRPTTTVRIGHNTGATGAVSVVGGDGTFDGWTSLTAFTLTLAENGGHASLTNNGGTIRVYGDWFNVDAYNSGTAHLQLNDGYLRFDGGTTTGIHFNVGSGGSIDLAGGTLALAGDHLDQLGGLILGGQLTSYGRTADATDFTTKFLFDYDTTHAGYTTISALYPMKKYLEWTEDYPEMGADTNLTDDADGDGVSNLGEYGMLGDPTDPNDQGTTPGPLYVPGTGGTNYFAMVYYERKDKDEVGLSYEVERDANHNLTFPAWTNSGVYYTGEVDFNVDFNEVTNAVFDVGEEKQFLRLRIGLQE